MKETMNRRNVSAAVLSAVLVACGPEEAGDASPTIAVEIDSTRLRELAQEYPRLGPEPLPPPEPAGGGDALETSGGDATYYARSLEGRRTASGIPFRHNQMVAAHRAYPFGTILRVTNLENQRSVNVRVVDRGPHGSSSVAKQTVIDLSLRAANDLGYVEQGRTPVRVEVLEWGSGLSG